VIKYCAFTALTAILLIVSVAVAVSGAGAAPKPTTQLIGLSSGGRHANCQDIDGSISGSGRLVVFATCATNLVKSSGAPWAQMYLHDRKTGKTTLLSKIKHGPADRDVSHPVVSHNGRFVVLTTAADNLGVANKANRGLVLRLDRRSGRFVRVSVARRGAPNADSGLQRGAISDNGRYVAFTSRATNLVTAKDTNNGDDVYVRDMRTNKTLLVSHTMTGQAAGSDGDVQISANGRYVVFASFSPDIVANDDNGPDAFLYDRVSNKIVSLSRNAVFNNFGQHTGSAPTISGNAGEACFVGSGGAGDLNYQVYCTHLRYSHHVPRTPASNSYLKVTKGEDRDSGYPMLSRKGDWVAFSSDATNLVGHDTNSAKDVFLARVGGKPRRVSVTRAGKQANDASATMTVDISDAGRYVLFDSAATNLVPKDKNNASDLFVRVR
jgi:Tol biopolymer transport system component